MKTEKSITETIASQLEELRTTYFSAVSDLESERAAREEESQKIQAASDELRLLLPAKAREAQRLADTLLLSGKPEEAEVKRAEQQQAERAPAEMEQRRRACAVRIEEIDSQKRAVARRVFQEWFPGFRVPLIESQQTLCTALDNAWAGVVAFAVETGTQVGPPFQAGPPSILTANLRSELTAREHGDEAPIFKKLIEWFGSAQ